MELGNQIISNILAQEKDDSHSGGALRAFVLPDDQTKLNFSKKVRAYVATDAIITKLRSALREQNAKKKELANEIITFMGQYGFEDLKAPNGIRLRCKTTEVNAPLTTKDIRERLKTCTGKTKEELENELFNNRKKVKKVSLRKLKNVIEL